MSESIKRIWTLNSIPSNLLYFKKDEDRVIYLSKQPIQISLHHQTVNYFAYHDLHFLVQTDPYFTKRSFYKDMAPQDADESNVAEIFQKFMMEVDVESRISPKSIISLTPPKYYEVLGQINSKAIGKSPIIVHRSITQITRNRDTRGNVPPCIYGEFYEIKDNIGISTPLLVVEISRDDTIKYIKNLVNLDFADFYPTWDRIKPYIEEEVTWDRKYASLSNFWYERKEV